MKMDLIERDITLTCVSNSVGGKYVGGARWLGVRLTDLLDHGRRRQQGRPDLRHRRRRHDDQHPAGPGHRRPRRDARDRHERRGAAPRARLPGPRRHPRPLRLHQRHQVGHPDDADDVRREAVVLDRAGLGHRRADQDLQPDRHPEGRSPNSRRARTSSAASPGHSRTAGSPRSRSASTAAPGRTPSSARRPATTTGASGSTAGTPRTPASTRSPRASSTATATSRSPRAPTRSPSGSSGIQELIVSVGVTAVLTRDDPDHRQSTNPPSRRPRIPSSSPPRSHQVLHQPEGIIP